MSDPSLFEPCPDYTECLARWELPRDLLGGTLAMRDRGTQWLPREPRESDAEYTIRRDRSVLFGAFSEAVREASASPFRREINIENVKRLSFDADAILDDVDLEGTPITEFARGLYEDAAAFGVSRILVEWDGDAGRPVWRQVKALDLPWWGFDDRGGMLSEIRIAGRMSLPIADAPSGIAQVETRRIYALRGEGWVEAELWYRRTGHGSVDTIEQLDEPVQLSDARGVPIEEIPLVSCYFNREGSMMARPPFEQLAWLNLRHWQSSSDQANILRYARVPVLAATGVREGDMDTDGGPRVLKAGGLMAFANPDARLFYVEPQGAAIAAGQQDLAHIEQQMERVGAKPDARRAGVQTATGQMIDESGRAGYRAAWARSAEKALTLALWWTERWYGSEMSADVRVNIQDDDQLSPAKEKQARLVLDFYKAGLITRVTALHEGKMAGVVSENLDIKQESELAEQEYDSPIRGALAQETSDEDDEDDESGNGDDQ